MKKLLYLSFLICLGCSQCNKPIKETPSRLDCGDSPSRYVPNEIILDAQGLAGDYGVVKQYLENKGFKKLDTCNCSHSIELWGNDQDVDVIGVIKDAGGAAGVMSGSAWRLSPNFVIVPDLSIARESPNREVRKATQTPNANPVKIAIIDTGVDPTNPYLSASDFLWKRNPASPAVCLSEGTYGLNVGDTSPIEPLDIQGHGTHINGIIAGVPTNTGDIGTVAFELLNVKFTSDTSQTGSLFKAVCGMYYGLDKGAQVFNLSWGYSGGKTPELIKSFLETAKTKNVIVVAGAGNFNENNDVKPFWPASFSDTFDFVISVGAYDANRTPLQFYNMTNYGKTVNVFAPGVDVKSTYLNSTSLASASGTSMATAYVTRAAAILRGKNPAHSAAKIKQCIIDNSKNKTVATQVVRIFAANDVIMTPCL